MGSKGLNINSTSISIDENGQNRIKRSVQSAKKNISSALEDCRCHSSKEFVCTISANNPSKTDCVCTDHSTSDGLNHHVFDTNGVWDSMKLRSISGGNQLWTFSSYQIELSLLLISIISFVLLLISIAFWIVYIKKKEAIKKFLNLKIHEQEKQSRNRDIFPNLR